MTQPEAQMEELLIGQLTHHESQWTFRPDIKTEAALWANLREKLDRINIAELQGVPLTDGEMDQVRNFLEEQAETTYKAARWLAGEHGIAQVPLVREDASLGKCSLKVINNREVAGGDSTYEVIHQLQSATGSRDRRFDVTLLINGLPMIHIELKNRQHAFMEAFRQIKKYGEEGQFRGLMGFVQMYVVSNGVETRYIAADNRGNLNEKFLTRWVDDRNEPVEDYLGFAKEALNIPAAHLMVGKYGVLDNDRKRVILLRPYQIHAIEACRKASRERQSGFIWHTTGSGKTLTSYTVTKNLLDIPSIDKTIFLIDRKDLDQQTSTSFMSYADSDDIDVTNTENTWALEQKLSNKDRTVIVTTIQKLQAIIRRCTEENPSPKYQQLRDRISAKNLAFVVDECHRAVTPETKRQIERFFVRSLWYGFTGTPIFAENKRARMGNLPRTTEELYGKCLHRYTIKEAIADRAVLGFHIQGMGQKEETFRKAAVDLGLYPEDEVGGVDAAALEVEVVTAFANSQKRDFYDSDEHRLQVIDYIVNQCVDKLRLRAPAGEAYEGLLTVPSIRIAQRYYRLFKAFKAEGQVSQKTQEILPDFPKIAITYTVGENEDGAAANQKEMAEALADYNAMFRTNWDLSTLAAYNADLNDRLARKKSRYRNRDEQLDLVIVVDRLLTGFDAPALSAIFLDRPPMKPEHLIQAFSRTNRLYDKTKRYGQVITLQTPNRYKKLIDEALLLYANGGTNDVAAPTWTETKKRAKKAVQQLRDVMKTPADCVREASTEELKAFVAAVQAVDRALGEAQVYDEFREEDLKRDFGITREEFDLYVGHYKNAVEELKARAGDGTEPEEIEIEIKYELETIRQVEVNYQYLVALLQSHMAEEAPPVSGEEEARIWRYIEAYKKTNPGVGRVLETLWSELLMNPDAFRGKDAQSLIETRIGAVLDEEFRRFAATWSVNPSELRAYAMSTPEHEVDADKVNTNMGDFKAYRAAGGKDLKVTYYRKLREAVAKLVKEKVKPLLRV
ncbi:MAG: HsdR family type I site-specific deoxyribonuclease [Sutterella sp.]|nr:HsdR family type I site-specific deoxyribonuclease [Sutterella sp.]